MHQGDTVTDFTAPDDHGQPWTLSNHGGRPVVLIFHRHLM
jgi:peroxiredoxin